MKYLQVPEKDLAGTSNRLVNFKMLCDLLIELRLLFKQTTTTEYCRVFCLVC